jgi:hypothetical protein
MPDLTLPDCCTHEQTLNSEVSRLNKIIQALMDRATLAKPTWTYRGNRATNASSISIGGLRTPIVKQAQDSTRAISVVTL